MHMRSVAAIDVADLLRPKAGGSPVNHNVIPTVREHKPDFDAMRRLVSPPKDSREVTLELGSEWERRSRGC